MASAYTPGLQATRWTRIEKIRELPLPGKCLVKVGDPVHAHTPVLAAELPGEIDILRIADRLGLDPQDVISGMKVKVDSVITPGMLICEVKSFFGLFKNQISSPWEGTVEYFTEANAHLGIRRKPVPLQVNAYLAGQVQAIEEGKSVTIESNGAFIQGIFGVGGENHGTLFALPFPPDQPITKENLTTLSESLSGKVLVGGCSFTSEALQFSRERGVSAVVTGSVDSETLFRFVGHEIGVSITGDEEVPFTFLVTEGFGSLPLSQRVFELAREFHGKETAVNGATQVRAGAMRPEIIIPSEKIVKHDKATPTKLETLEIGSKIRAIRVPFFGELGTVAELPHEPVLIPTGAKVRVLKAQLEKSGTVIIPRANVELVS